MCLVCVHICGWTYTSFACRYILDDVDRHWGYHDKNNDGFITLDEYQETSYGVIEGES